jgi:thymidylate synthase (FAD)
MKGKTMPVPLNETFPVDGQYGFIIFHDAMLRDPSDKVAQAARVSYGNEDSEKPSQKLISFLAREEHTSPFRHSPISIIVQCPEFVARQWYKHVVGGPYSFVDTGWNEISGRYVEYDKFYVPPAFYMQSKSSKQGSTDTVSDDSEYYRGWAIGAAESLTTMYQRMIAAGIAKEQARTILPMSLYTRFMWTATEQALHHFVRLRNKPDAQREIRQYAAVLDHICSQHYGVSWDALKEADEK